MKQYCVYPDGKCRCHWVNPKNERYIRYHDTEWGNPTHDDAKLFEMLMLETFQAGLSWECILNKRDAFRRAFDNFDIAAICTYDDNKLSELAQDTGIIRNVRKIAATINNARVFSEIVTEYGTFDKYLWHWTCGRTIYEFGKTKSGLSDKISDDLRRRGMRFVGTTTIYAYLQSTGVINSHEPGCWMYNNHNTDVHEHDIL